MIRKLPEHGTLRRTKRFALLPVETDDGYLIWLEWYTEVERYDHFRLSNGGWVLQACLYEETQDGLSYIDRSTPDDLHDLPKRITTWHNVYNDWIGPDCFDRRYADKVDEDTDEMKRLCVYRIERDEGGRNPEIFEEEA